MSKFTPGPWEKRWTGFGSYTIDKEGTEIAEVFYSVKGFVENCRLFDRETAEAHADLIAAAPEMYRVLEWLLRLNYDACECWATADEWIEAWDEAERVLRKVEGGAE